MKGKGGEWQNVLSRKQDFSIFVGLGCHPGYVLRARHLRYLDHGFSSFSFEKQPRYVDLESWQSQLTVQPESRPYVDRNHVDRPRLIRDCARGNIWPRITNLKCPVMRVYLHCGYQTALCCGGENATFQCDFTTFVHTSNATTWIAVSTPRSP